jgi:hypothetical protein
MEPLDLSKAHPRRAREELAGIIFLPRSIDKARALLPGGVANGYTIEGFSEKMLDTLKIPVADFMALVARAQSDDDVAAYVVEHAAPGGAEAWNAGVLKRELYQGNREEAIAENPWLADHPEIKLSLDFLQYREDHGLDND